jgi:1-acyl-sn-glycerol-3-phosphate acyltransferase
MVYRFLYYFANLIIRLYYRKFYVHGLDQIPKDKPLLIVSNHPNGFLEPIVMACLFPIDLHFLVRGDLFENKALRWLLVFTNQVPIYRFKDGIAALRNNQKTIEKTIEVLKKNKAVIIFAEGSTDGAWYVRDLKKGMARMAFQCLDGSPSLDLHILPIGVTFQRANLPGTDVILNAGKAFSVKTFYTKNAKEAKDKMDVLTEFTKKEIEKLTLHVENRKDEEILRQNWQHYINTEAFQFWPRVKQSSKLFEKLKNDEASLNNQNRVDEDFAPYQTLSGYVMMPFALLGFLIWCLPISIGFFITHRYVKQIEFESSVRAAVSGFLVLIYTLICIVIGLFTIGFAKTAAILIMAIILGISTIYTWERFKLQESSKRYDKIV